MGLYPPAHERDDQLLSAARPHHRPRTAQRARARPPGRRRGPRRNRARTACPQLRSEDPRPAVVGRAHVAYADRHWVVEYWDGGGWRLTDPQVGRSDLTRDDFQDGLTAWNRCRGGASAPALYGNGELWGWDELRGSLINDVAALNKIEVSGWYWCDRIKVDPLDQPHGELDASLDILSRLAATAESAETILVSGVAAASGRRCAIGRSPNQVELAVPSISRLTRPRSCTFKCR